MASVVIFTIFTSPRAARRSAGGEYSEPRAGIIGSDGEPPISWKVYLLRILHGEDPEFDWNGLYASPLVDERVLRRAIAFLAERVAGLPEPAPYRLLHGDLNPHNILVDRGELTGIIGWSYARYGERLFDFARLRMNPFIRQEPAATALYFALLDLTPEERAREQLYYLFNLVEYVNWYSLSRYPEKVREHIALLRELLTAG